MEEQAVGRFTVFILSGLIAAASPAAVAMPADLAEAAQRYEHAQINGERETLERLVADDYVLIAGDGSRQAKADLIAWFTSPDITFNPVEPREVIEHVWTDGAALGATVELSGVSGGEPFSQTMRYIDVWRKTSDGWRVLYGQVTRAPAE